MKRLKSLLLLSFAWTCIALGAGDCDYFLQKNNISEHDAFYAYNYNMCLGFSVIDHEAISYIHEIKKTVGKTPTNLINEVGNIFCRGYFGTCDETSYNNRYIQACVSAREKTIASLPPQSSININHELFIESYIACEDMAQKRLQAFKEASIEEIARYHDQLLEKSNESYFKETHKKMNNFITTMDTFLKKMSDISSHFQGFIKRIYDGK